MSGKRAQKMTSTALNGRSMALLQALEVEPNQPYRLNGQVYAAELNNAQTKLTVAFYDARYIDSMHFVYTP
ncbi:hypothetical protein ET33_01640 [Paenibacillus tyrfis]|uniref:Uncharacterized protein n=1 Tax=Paenibacillus tyrfis TaxID=1501230 RepID=A0A081P428_9BACL|nr:hypothetical protein ET33_01640 [Paenibacillus tyrfis]